MTDSGERKVSFHSRWLIRGRLVLDAPLALRTGDAEEREMPGADEDDVAPSVALVHRAFDGRPMIPGSSLKGVLRHWLAARLPGNDEDVRQALKALLGHGPEPVPEKPDQEASTGGRAEVHDAIAAWAVTTGQRDEAPPALPLRSSTAIDPDTRTAERRKLFHGEQVPKGATFCVEITGDNLDCQPDGKPDPKAGDVELLLAALEGFNTGSGDIAPSLGGGGSTGKGRASWHLDEVRCMDARAVALWLREPVPRSWRKAIVEMPSCRQDAGRWRERARTRLAKWDRPAFVRLEIELVFDGPFLVKDPQRQDPDADRRGGDDQDRSAKPSLPRLDERGLPLLPGESVKGALRAQAGRIYRTVPRAADGNGSKDEPDPLVMLFGDTKHRAMLDVDDFRRVDARGLGRQQFVAIDRFTGGAAPGRLYLFEHADRPVMRGALTLSLRRGETKIGRGEIGLLALTLRDLVEGDITFGLGAAKGYGACTARIVSCAVAGGLPAELEALPGLGAARAAGWPCSGAKRNYGKMLQACVEALNAARIEAYEQTEAQIARAAPGAADGSAAGAAGRERAAAGAAGSDDGNGGGTAAAGAIADGRAPVDGRAAGGGSDGGTSAAETGAADG